MKQCIVKVNLAANGKVGIDNPYEKDSFVTPINGTIEEVEKYYSVGKTFNLGCWAGGHEDNLMHVTKTFILPKCEETRKFVEYLGEKYGWNWADYFCKEEYEKFCA